MKYVLLSRNSNSKFDYKNKNIINIGDRYFLVEYHDNIHNEFSTLCKHDRKNVDIWITLLPAMHFCKDYIAPKLYEFLQSKEDYKIINFWSDYFVRNNYNYDYEKDEMNISQYNERICVLELSDNDVQKILNCLGSDLLLMTEINH